EEIKTAAGKHLFSERLNRFVRRLVPRDAPKPPDSPTYKEPAPLAHADAHTTGALFEVDETIDASLYAVYKFHLFDADDPRVESTMKPAGQRPWVKTRAGGVARYDHD